MITAFVPKTTSSAAIPDLHALLSPHLVQVDKVIAQSMASQVPLIPQLSQYILQAGGKRLRPLLTLAGSFLVGEVSQATLYLAATVELIHTATLLHDDVIDESSLRRNQPSAHTLWGNKASILVGDYLFTQAFQLMVKADDLLILQVLSRAAARIVEGEVLQLSYGNTLDITMEQALAIIQAKTAELFAAACKVGVMVAGGTMQQAEKLYEFGYHLGLAFQVIDDLLDYQASSAQLGKMAGDDFREGKITLPIILTLPHCNDNEQAFWQRCFKDGSQDPKDFLRALEILKCYNGIQTCQELAQEHSQKSIEALNYFPVSPVQQALINVVEKNLVRKN